jgi:hypothetical protein
MRGSSLPRLLLERDLRTQHEIFAEEFDLGDQHFHEGYVLRTMWTAGGV